MNAAVPTMVPTNPTKRARRRRSRQPPATVVIQPPAPPRQPRPRGNSRGRGRGLARQFNNIRISGRGGYFADTAGAYGGDVGSSVGQYLGHAAGRAAGGLADAGVDYILGRGAYSIRKNSIMGMSAGIPTFKTRPDVDRTEIFHKEFIGDVIATGSPNWSVVGTYTWNAGLASVLPYLAQLGVNFEECEWIGLVVAYETTSGSVSTSQALGSVQISTQYDMSDLPFASQIEMLDYEYSTVTSPNISTLHPIECEPTNNQLTNFYTRAGLINGTTSAVDTRYNLYDIGRTIVALAGVPAASGTVLGKLFGVYHVGLRKPKLFTALGLAILQDEFTATYTTVGAALGNFTTVTPDTTNTIGGTLTVTAPTYYFPIGLGVGTFLITYYTNGFGGGTMNDLWTPANSLTNCVPATGRVDGPSEALTGGTTLAAFQFVTISRSQAAVTLQPGFFVASAAAVTGTLRVVVTQTAPVPS